MHNFELKRWTLYDAPKYRIIEMSVCGVRTVLIELEDFFLFNLNSRTPFY